MRSTGQILVEGGSEERDRVEWMLKYSFPPLHTLMLHLRACGFDCQIYEPFPSLTKIRGPFQMLMEHLGK